MPLPGTSAWSVLLPPDMAECAESQLPATLLRELRGPAPDAVTPWLCREMICAGSAHVIDVNEAGHLLAAGGNKTI